MAKLNKTGNSRAAENLSKLGGSYEGTEVDETLNSIKRNRALANEMGKNRRTAGFAPSGGDFAYAIPRMYDPEQYWKNSDLPYDAQDEEHRKRLLPWLRMYYTLHPLVPMLIDIFTRFPLVGIELTSKDDRLTEFYTNLFMDQLDYGEFLVQLGREYWTVGEAYPLGNFNETLGIWDREELIPTEDVIVNNYPLLGTKQFEIVPPEYLKELAMHRSPMREYQLLEQNYPELVDILKKNRNIPVSDQLMRQVAFKVNDWDNHGTPILMRGLRTLIHEEKLMAAQEAIADRLYAPLLLAKMGIQDIGDGQPWIPGHDELMALRDDIDIALASDFRLLVHHFGLEISNVFGREQMPRLDSDFDRVNATLMQLFGINPQLLQGGVSNVPYASSALQAEFLNQILRTYQNYLKRHFMERAKLVAEAQGHYDYEKKGDKRIPIMEEQVIVDEEGNYRVEKKHKLLIPDMNMKVLDLRDEATQRQFLAQLKGSGVPVSDETFMVGMPTKFPEELEKTTEESIQKTIAQQKGKLKLYKLLRIQNLPIPQALAAEVGAMVEGTGALQQPEGLGIDVPGATDQFAMPAEPGAPGLEGGSTVPGGAPGAAPITGPAGTVPEISTQRTPIGPTAKVSLAAIDQKLAELEEDEPLPYGMVEENGVYVVKANKAPIQIQTSLVDYERFDNES